MFGDSQSKPLYWRERDLNIVSEFSRVLRNCSRVNEHTCDVLKT